MEPQTTTTYQWATPRRKFGTHFSTTADPKVPFWTQAKEKDPCVLFLVSCTMWRFT